jgi:hypothetical protein
MKLVNGEHQLLYWVLGALLLAVSALSGYGITQVMDGLKDLHTDLDETRQQMRTMYLHFNDRVGACEQELAGLKGPSSGYPKRVPHGPDEWR